MSAKRKINEKVGIQVIEYYLKDNLSITKISKLIGVSVGTVSSYLKSKGINVVNYQNIPKIDNIIGETIKKHYIDDKLSIEKISKLTNICTHSISKYLKSIGISVINYQNRTKFDETIFDTIDSEEKAYWLGFIFADGYISYNRYSFELSLCFKDINHLHKFNIFMKHENNNVKISNVGKDGKFKRCRWSIVNKHLWNTLNNYGCTPRKSLTLKFPNISKIWYKDFIRGYFDGDGCITYLLDKPKKVYFPVSVLEGTYEFLQKIKNILDDNSINQSKIVKRNNIYALRIYKNNSREFLEYIYGNSNIYLERKYKRYEFFKIGRSDKELSEFLAGEIGENCDVNAEVN